MRWTSNLLAAMTFFGLSFVASHTYAAQVFVSVNSDQTNPKDICRMVSLGLNSMNDAYNNVTCANVDDVFMPKEVNVANNSHMYRYHISVRQKGSSFRVVAYNWIREDAADFTTAVWNIPSAEWKQGLFERMQHLAQFDANKRLVKQVLLDQGLKESKQIDRNANGNYREVTSGRILSFTEAYKIYLQETPRQREFLQAGVEISVVLGIGMVMYVSNVANLEDQDFTFWGGLGKKATGEQIRFDDNAVGTNLGHSFAGWLYYVAARTNHFSSLESFLTAFATSALWEVMEYKEVFSVNDMLFTPVGGFAIGEATFQIGRVLRSRNNIIARILGYGVNPIQGLESLGVSLLGKENLQRSENFNYEGFAKVGVSFGQLLDKSPVFAFESKAIPLAEWGQPGKSRELYYDTALAQLDATRSEAFTEFIARAVFAAYYEKSKNAKGDGYEFLVGPSTSVTYRSQDDVAGTRDYIGKVTLFGPIAYVELTKGDLKFTAEVEVSPAFAMIRSLVIDDLIADTGSAGLKSTLVRRGYYFGLGVASRAQASFSYKDIVEVGGSYGIETYDSVDGHDRRQELVTRDYNHADKATSRAWFVRVNVTKSLSIQFREETWNRKSRIENLYSTKAKEKVRMASIHYMFN